MPESDFYAGSHPGSDDPYAAFTDIFGRPPPPGRIPYGPAPAVPAQSSSPVPALPPLPQQPLMLNGDAATAASYSPKVAMHSDSSVSVPTSDMSQLSTDSAPPRPDPVTRSVSLGMVNEYALDKNGSRAADHATPRIHGMQSSSDLNRRASEDHTMTRSVSQVWSGLKKQVAMQRSASSTTVNMRKPVTKGGRTIPSRSDLSAFSSGSSTVGSYDDFDRRSPSRKSSTATVSSLGSRSTIVATSRREPLVYPALLSRVAQKFRERMAPVLGDRVKNELTYKNAFTGSEAVDVIAYIIKTPDRNLALLLGRSLDAQKLFHDVTYDSRLRDLPNEVYQFTTFDDQSNNVPEPNGVFTLLSECYSPTCSRNRLCYSISCPRRLEQQARLNMKLDPGLIGSTNQAEASISLDDGEDKEEKLWRWTVSPEVLESTPPKEQKRQEAIAELVYTERQFVKSLEYLRECWIKPLRRSTILGPDHRRDRFIRMVFLNVLEVHAVNLKFAEALTRRQQLAPVVNQIADVVLEFVPRFEPFVTYGAQQMYAKYEFEKERAINPVFAKFVQDTEREPESQQLELNGYLTKPTTRLARYPLLLDAILKRTEPDNPDAKNIPLAITQIREFLFKVNEETGKAENRFSLHQLNQALTFRAGEYVDLHLLNPKRQLVFKGHLKKRPPPGEGNVQVYLFDNAVLFAKRKKATGMSSTAAAAAAAAAAAVEPPSGDDSTSGRDVLRVNSKPIPLPLLLVAEGEEIGRRKAAAHMIRNTVTRNAEGKATFPITFQHLGRRGYEVTLYAENFQARKTWVDIILKQQEGQRKSANILSQHSLYTSAAGSGRAQSSVTLDDGRRVLFGTDRGVFMANVSYQDKEGRFNPVSSMLKPIIVTTAPVVQLDVVEKHGIVLMLYDRTLSAFSLDLLDSNVDISVKQRSIKQLANQVNFYKVDECLGKTLLIVVKSTNLSSTIRVLEPTGPPPTNSKRPPLRRLLTSGGGSPQQPDGFRLMKPPIDIPSATLSLTFLRSHLCLGCSRGFELLDLETGKFESLLDPADTSLDFVIKRESLKPISLHRIGKEFLLNYSDFSFFINRNGWRSRPDWIIQWECNPQHIILSYPYLVAFDHSLIEVRNMDTELVRVIHGEGIRFLCASNHDILYAVENEKGGDEVVSLNFWEQQNKKPTAK